MEITIQNIIYTIKYSIRSILIFEQLTGKVFQLETLTDIYIFFYSMLLANNADNTLTFDDFIDEIQPDQFDGFQQYLTEVFNQQSQFSKEEAKKKL